MKRFPGIQLKNNGAAQKGFSLIECMIYLACSIPLFIILSQILFNYHFHLNTLRARNQYAMMLYAAGDLLTSDIEKAVADQSVWHAQQNMLVFKNDEYAVGWKLKKRVLVRNTGRFDFVKQSWIKKNQSVIAKEIDQFLCTLKSNQTGIEMVEFLLKGPQQSIEKKVRLINRVVL